MGMFDRVNVEIDCPKCSSVISGFQSKDRWCVLDTVDPDNVDNFYSSCSECENWVEFSMPRREKAPEPARETPYTLQEVVALGFVMVEGMCDE